MIQSCFDLNQRRGRSPQDECDATTQDQDTFQRRLPPPTSDEWSYVMGPPPLYAVSARLGEVEGATAGRCGSVLITVAIYQKWSCPPLSVQLGYTLAGHIRGWFSETKFLHQSRLA